LCSDGAWVEEKGATLTLHYRDLTPERGAVLAQAAREVISAAGFQPRDARCAVEARPPIAWDKGHAALHVLRERTRAGVGRPRSRDLRRLTTTPTRTRSARSRGSARRSGSGPASNRPSARRRLRDVSAVEAMLRWLAARS
jgi:hypothetical protein